jgi:magnesium transporter
MGVLLDLQLNERAYVVSLVATIFVPLTFITGFFGMNFFEPVAGLVGWTTRQVFIATVSIMLLFPIGMFFWMRQRRWV